MKEETQLSPPLKGRLHAPTSQVSLDPGREVTAPGSSMPRRDSCLHQSFSAAIVAGHHFQSLTVEPVQ